MNQLSFSKEEDFSMKTKDRIRWQTIYSFDVIRGKPFNAVILLDYRYKFSKLIKYANTVRVAQTIYFNCTVLMNFLRKNVKYADKITIEDYLMDYIISSPRHFQPTQKNCNMLSKYNYNKGRSIVPNDELNYRNVVRCYVRLHFNGTLMVNNTHILSTKGIADIYVNTREFILHNENYVAYRVFACGNSGIYDISYCPRNSEKKLFNINYLID